jgi:hypothetical protein
MSASKILPLRHVRIECDFMSYQHGELCFRNLASVPITRFFTSASTTLKGFPFSATSSAASAPGNDTVTRIASSSSAKRLVAAAHDLADVIITDATFAAPIRDQFA